MDQKAKEETWNLIKHWRAGALTVLLINGMPFIIKDDYLGWTKEMLN